MKSRVDMLHLPLWQSGGVPVFLGPASQDGEGTASHVECLSPEIVGLLHAAKLSSSAAVTPLISSESSDREVK